MLLSSKHRVLRCTSLALSALLTAAAAAAQTITYPAAPLTYPMTSDRYAVQYKVDNSAWTSARVYVSYYGGTNASPYASYSHYISGSTSMSFVSIPARSNANVEMRVTKLWDAPFLPTDNVSVRPGAKSIPVSLAPDGTVHISTSMPSQFAGEQFILWWNRNSQQNGGVQGLAIFLTPPYSPPPGNKVLKVSSSTDLKGDLTGYDSLALYGNITIGATGDHALVVPSNIHTVYLAPGAWVQGKLAFMPNSGSVRHIYGPGVLDASRFNYGLRKNAGDQGFPAITTVKADGTHTKLEGFDVEGIVIADPNFFSTDLFVNSTLNDVKVITWNGNCDGLEFGTNARASNVFVRSGDDSLKLWGASDSITNATVWQNYNGGCVNLGWFDNSPGDGGLIDGLYVVKTDWFTPKSPSWIASDADILAHQNNAIIASCMVPGTQFDVHQPSLYRNIFVDDPPWVLFSLKILPPALHNPALFSTVDLKAKSVLNLTIANLVSPQSSLESSIGFQTLPEGYTFFSQHFNESYPLQGSMNIRLSNVTIITPEGEKKQITRGNAKRIGRISTNGDNVNIDYDH